MIIIPGNGGGNSAARNMAIINNSGGLRRRTSIFMVARCSEMGNILGTASLSRNPNSSTINSTPVCGDSRQQRRLRFGAYSCFFFEFFEKCSELHTFHESAGLWRKSQNFGSQVRCWGNCCLPGICGQAPLRHTHTRARTRS